MTISKANRDRAKGILENRKRDRGNSDTYIYLEEDRDLLGSLQVVDEARYTMFGDLGIGHENGVVLDSKTSGKKLKALITTLGAEGASINVLTDAVLYNIDHKQTVGGKELDAASQALKVFEHYVPAREAVIINRKAAKLDKMLREDLE